MYRINENLCAIGSQKMHVLDRLRSELPKEPNSQKLDFASEFSVVVQPSETVVPPTCFSDASLPGIYDDSFRTANPLHSFFDKSEVQI